MIRDARRYAYGFFIDQDAGGARWSGHDDAGLETGIADMSGQLLFQPATGDIIVALSNFEAPVAAHAAWHLAARLPLRE